MEQVTAKFNIVDVIRGSKSDGYFVGNFRLTPINAKYLTVLHRCGGS
jgi:hypothetical protein